MTRRPKIWVRVPSKPPEAEKRAIAARCDAFIAEVLTPRFLPEIRPQRFNYPIGLRGAWRGHSYRFITQWRIGPDIGPDGTFDSPFARFDYLGPNLFDILWHRHTGQWWPLHHSKTLDEALVLMESDGVLHPVC